MKFNSGSESSSRDDGDKLEDVIYSKFALGAPTADFSHAIDTSQSETLRLIPTEDLSICPNTSKVVLLRSSDTEYAVVFENNESSDAETRFSSQSGKILVRRLSTPHVEDPGPHGHHRIPLGTEARWQLTAQEADVVLSWLHTSIPEQ